MGTAKAKDGRSGGLDSGKYARYTPEQVEILERVYNDCPKPSSSRRHQLIKDCPILANIGHKQLKVWFQNRRCREKQRKEFSRLNSWNSKLNAMNQILMEENERLQKQSAHLTSENHYLRQQLQLQQPNVDLNPRSKNVIIANTADTSSESVVTSGQHQHSPQHCSQEWSLLQLSAIAEKTLAEFLTKATGTVIDGIPLPGMKPGPDSIGAFALNRLNGGVAAQACGIVSLQPFKVAEIAKNRPLWLQDCRRIYVLANFAAERGGLLELVHTQMYASTIPSSTDVPWDFWTLRYTCCLEDGSLVICEKSLAAGQVIQEVPVTRGFVRAEMLTSGFLIRPCEEGGSMVMVIDDMNFTSGSFIQGLRPLYESSVALARRLSYKVLCFLLNVAREKGDLILASDPISSLFSHRLIRGFNDAVNCFPDEGWVSVINDGPSAISVHIKPPPSCKQLGDAWTGSRHGIICAKTSFLLQGVSATLLMRFVKDRWMSWVDFGEGSIHDDSIRTNPYALPKKKFTCVRVFQPSAGEGEALEVMRIQKPRSGRGEDTLQSDDFLLQLRSGLEDIAVGEYAQLLFAPIDASVPDDAPLLPSGFRVTCLGGLKENCASSETLDLASSLEDRLIEGPLTWGSKSNDLQGQISMVTITFQYMYKAESRDILALHAQRHLQAIVNVLQHAVVSVRPHASPAMSLQSGVEALNLVQQIADSYRVYLGQELLPCSVGNPEAMLKSFWSLRDSIICCAWKPLPEFIFANPSALEMLETSSGSLRELSLERMFNDSCSKTDYSHPPPFLQNDGYACLPAGICRTSTGRPVAFERATGWKVLTNNHYMHVAAFMFCNWSLPLQQ